MSKKGRNIRILVSALLILIGFSFCVVAGDLLPLQGNVDLSGTPVSSSGLVVEIWDGPDVAGSNLVYNSTDNYTGTGNISAGKFDIVLGSVGDELNLEYGKVYYLDLFIAGNNMNFSSQERQIFMSSVGIINSSFLNTSNDYELNSLLIDNKTAITTAYLNISDGATPKLIVDSAGKVGIGTIAPSVELDVSGMGYFSGNVSFADNLTVGGNVLYVDSSSGNVGIGTTNPDGMLTIYDAGNTRSDQIKLGADATNYYRIGRNVGNGFLEFYGNQFTYSGYSFYTTPSGSLNVLQILNNGNVGIGTTAPGYLLDVKGNVSLNDTLYVTGAGQVVIGGSDAPANSSMILTVVGGDLNVSGSIYYGGSQITGSPFVVQSIQGEPIPICMKNSEGKWVGCMPDANNNWQCAPNRECDKKVLRVEAERELKGKGLDDKEVGEKVEAVRQKFEQGKELKDIKEEIKAEIGDMEVLDELDDNPLRGGGFGVQGSETKSATAMPPVSDTYGEEINNLRDKIESLEEEITALKALINSSQSATTSEQLAQPKQRIEEKSPAEETSKIPSEQPQKEPTQEEPGFSITGASVWRFFSNLF